MEIQDSCAVGFFFFKHACLVNIYEKKPSPLRIKLQHIGVCSDYLHETVTKSIFKGVYPFKAEALTPVRFAFLFKMLKPQF